MPKDKSSFIANMRTALLENHIYFIYFLLRTLGMFTMSFITINSLYYVKYAINLESS